MFDSVLNDASASGLFAELDRLQRAAAHQAFGSARNIRAAARPFPALNVGHTPEAVEILALVPGVDASSLDVTVDRGLLTLSGERTATVPAEGERASVYANERYTGKFKRVVSLPEDADPARITARYRDGALRITVARQEAAQPRRIEVR